MALSEIGSLAGARRATGQCHGQPAGCLGYQHTPDCPALYPLQPAPGSALDALRLCQSQMGASRQSALFEGRAQGHADALNRLRVLGVSEAVLDELTWRLENILEVEDARCRDD